VRASLADSPAEWSGEVSAALVDTVDGYDNRLGIEDADSVSVGRGAYEC